MLWRPAWTKTEIMIEKVTEHVDVGFAMSCVPWSLKKKCLLSIHNRALFFSSQRRTKRIYICDGTDYVKLLFL